MPPLLVVGAIRRPHGLGGELLVEVLTDFPERFRPGLVVVWRRGADEKTLHVRSARSHADALLLRFDECEGIEAARALRGGELCVTEAETHPAPEGYFYAHEIQGFACEDTRGRRIGEASGLEKTPAGPMLSVAIGDGREALVPWTHPIVVRVDRPGRRIVLDPPEGLFEL
jgi:16S rRNA processing protein RimM